MKMTHHQTLLHLPMHNDDSATLLIDDKQILSNWGTKTANDVTNTQVGTFAATAGKSYRFQIRYGYDGNAKGRMALEISYYEAYQDHEHQPCERHRYTLSNK
jgi:hypothetical protein